MMLSVLEGSSCFWFRMLGMSAFLNGLTAEAHPVLLYGIFEAAGQSSIGEGIKRGD